MMDESRGGAKPAVGTRPSALARGVLPFFAPLAVGLHLLFWVSLPTGLLDRFFNDATHRIGKGGDFFQFYQAGANLLRGLSIFRYGPSDSVPYGPHNRYPPLLPATLGVLAQLLPPEAAYAAWTVTIGVLFAATVYLLRRVVGPAHHAFVACFCLAYTPLYVELYHGQTNALGALLVTLLVLTLERTPRVRDAWMLAVTLNVKLNTALLIPALVRRKHLAWLAAAGALAALLFVPYFVLFPADVGAFLSVFKSQGQLYQAGNLGSYPLLQDIVYGVTYDGGTVMRVQVAFTGLVLVTTMAVHFRARAAAPIDLVALWLATFFLAFKFVWEHHLVMALPLLALEYRRGDRRTVALLWALLALPTTFALIDFDLGPGYTEVQPFWTTQASALYHSCKVVPLLVLYGVVAARLLGRTPRPREAVAALALAWGLGAAYFTTRPLTTKDECALGLQSILRNDLDSARAHFERSTGGAHPWRDGFVRYADMLAGLGDAEGAARLRKRAAELPP